MEFIGWLGSILLALCAVPQAWSSWRTKSSKGVSGAFLTMWFGGEILMFIYILPTGDGPLLTNYGLNMTLLSIIVYYKLKPR